MFNYSQEQFIKDKTKQYKSILKNNLAFEYILQGAVFTRQINLKIDF